MKNYLAITLLFVSVVFPSIVIAAGMPAMDVTVSDASGKVAFKGKTSASGTFATSKLEPGNYVVQFSANSAAVKGNQYALVISAGKKKVSANAVAGEKFAAGGVAMKLDGVGRGMNVTGQVANGQMASSNPNVKMINGKRFVWVKGGGTGSNLGGRWVEEGSPEALNVGRISRQDIGRMQEHADTHQEGFPTGR